MATKKFDKYYTNDDFDNENVYLGKNYIATRYNDNNWYIEYDVKFAKTLKEMLNSIKFDLIEDSLRDYVIEEISRKDIIEDISNVYSMIQCKAYDLLCDYIKDYSSQYSIMEKYDIDDLCQSYLEYIDISCADDILEDIVNKSITVEDMLLDVGMSIKDFI